jgi:hypothetical protein
MIHILKADLMVRKLLPKHGLVIPRAGSLSFVQSDFRIIVVPEKVAAVDRDIFEGGPIPRRLLVFQVSQEAFLGSYKTNPLNLEHFNCSHISVSVDGQTFPDDNGQLRMQFGGDTNAYKLAYMMMQVQLFDHELDEVLGARIAADQFSSGFFIWPIRIGATGHLNGPLKLRIEYDKPLDKSVVVMVIAEYDKVLKMDANGKIAID